MTTSSRIIVVIASAVILLSFLMPVWSISLSAPQYPEGIGIYIWLNDIVGHQPHDLKKLNQLNHYIGMQAIAPEEIPELRIFPLFIFAFCFFGILAAVINSWKLIYLWCLSYLVFALGGLVDFYRWGYDYGHNLDPTAPIQVPGMSYQPPIIGSKVVLNFIASSYPFWGTLPLLISGVLMFYIALRERKLRKRSSKSVSDTTRNTVNVFIIATFICAALLACKDEASIHWGSDVCQHCRMVLSDKKFGAVIVNEHGKARTFDAIECVVRHQEENPESGTQQILLVPFDDPNTLVSKPAAHIVQSEALKSPMGESLAAFSNQSAAKSFLKENGGTTVRWQDLPKALDKKEHQTHSHHH